MCAERLALQCLSLLFGEYYLIRLVFRLYTAVLLKMASFKNEAIAAKNLPVLLFCCFIACSGRSFMAVGSFANRHRTYMFTHQVLQFLKNQQ